MDVDPNLVPIVSTITFFTFLGLVIILVRRYRWREREKMFEITRTAIEKGQTLDPAVVQALAEAQLNRRTAFQDLRWGVVIAALGVGIALFGVLIGSMEGARGALKPLVGIGAIPTVIGVALIVLSRFNPYKDKPN